MVVCSCFDGLSTRSWFYVLISIPDATKLFILIFSFFNAFKLFKNIKYGDIHVSSLNILPETNPRSPPDSVHSCTPSKHAAAF